MARTNPAERFSLDNQLLARIQDIKSAKLAHREACLLLAQQPDNADRAQAVTELEAEIASHELAIERLDAAKLAQSEGAVQQAATDRIKAAKDAAHAVTSITPKIRAVLERLVDAFELTVGPALAELESLQRERAAHAWAALSGVTERQLLERNVNRTDRLTGDAPARTALLSALVRAGVGHVGPSLAPYITVSAPLGGAGTPDQALESFAAQAKDLDAYLAEAIERAVNPQPATADLE